jgi:hypothetical protein
LVSILKYTILYFSIAPIYLLGSFLHRQAFIREKAVADANRPVPSPTIESFPPFQPIGQGIDKESRLNRIRAHSQRLSSKFCNYSPVCLEEEESIADMLTSQASGGVDCEVGELEEKLCRWDWDERDSVTLSGSEKDGATRV